ncbi:LysR family transcriptional regulator [Sphingomonas sp. CFBP9021]|uniref:LysR family transcriptional regulator n=1 Tax=Sphingomonas sp. CFBP9021 TaxID=3096534 RepID=UPI002A6B7CAC|nr:LysR family transcriptional regulator [Sphingomonas sp. CFBP9021]MDY0969111.1 LysR family transcriptional regulator [Sphingomonas sp. CFBP9021]
MNTDQQADFTDLQWEDVRLFRAIRRLGSMRKVATDHGVVVNTIRRRIERVETRLGLHLIRRSANGIVLTEEGEKLLRIGQAMSDAVEWDASDGTKDVLVRPGQITIACTEGIGTLWLTPRMSRLQVALPDMTIGLDFDYNLARDRTHEADVWLTYEQPAEADLITAKLATIHFAVYASKSYIQRHGIPSTVDSLKNHRIVEHIGPGVRSEQLDFLIGTERPQGLIAMRTNSSLSQLWSVAQGVGIGALPTFVSEITNAAAPVPPELRIRRELWLVYRSKAKPSQAILATVRWLRECFDHGIHPCFADTYIDPNSFRRDSGETNIMNIFQIHSRR